MENKVAKLIALVQKLPESCLDEAIGYVKEKIGEEAEECALPGLVDSKKLQKAE